MLYSVFYANAILFGLPFLNFLGFSSILAIALGASALLPAIITGFIGLFSAVSMANFVLIFRKIKKHQKSLGLNSEYRRASQFRDQVINAKLFEKIESKLYTLSKAPFISSEPNEFPEYMKYMQVCGKDDIRKKDGKEISSKDGGRTFFPTLTYVDLSKVPVLNKIPFIKGVKFNLRVPYWKVAVPIFAMGAALVKLVSVSISTVAMVASGTMPLIGLLGPVIFAISLYWPLIALYTTLVGPNNFVEKDKIGLYYKNAQSLATELGNNVIHTLDTPGVRFRKKLGYAFNVLMPLGFKTKPQKGSKFLGSVSVLARGPKDLV
jgi:hypothetical protein